MNKKVKSICINSCYFCHKKLNHNGCISKTLAIICPECFKKEIEIDTKYNINVNDDVKKIHVYDGTLNAGKPIGKILKVISIKDHIPIDGPREKDCIVYLSDNTWEFIWNLYKL